MSTANHIGLALTKQKPSSGYSVLKRKVEKVILFLYSKKQFALLFTPKNQNYHLTNASSNCHMNIDTNSCSW